MRQKRGSRGLARDIRAFHDHIDSDAIEEAVKHTRAKVKSPSLSPQTVFCKLDKVPEMNLPNALKLPKAAIKTQLEMPVARALPLTAVWGARHKLVQARFSRQAILEKISGELADEQLDMRSRLPVKTIYFGSKREQKCKEKERGLREKHWKKHRAERRSARAAHEAYLLAEEAKVAVEDIDEVQVAESTPCRLSPTRKKIRRQQRRFARDSKCFAAEDAIEAAAVMLTVMKVAKDEQLPTPAQPRPHARRKRKRVFIIVPGESDATQNTLGQDIILDAFTDEQLDMRSRLPVKTICLDSKKEQKRKEKERGLREKHWKKHRAERRAARAAHEAYLLAEEAKGVESEGDELLEDRIVAERKQPRCHAAKREKIRRQQRRFARDSRCFAAEDAIEAAALMPTVMKVAKDEQLPTPAQPLPPLPLDLILRLISSEPIGASLRCVFAGGVGLSCPAAQDLEQMMNSMSANGRQLQLKAKCRMPESVPPVGKASPRWRVSRFSFTPTAKGCGGAAAYLRKPSSMKAQGKRHS